MPSSNLEERRSGRRREVRCHSGPITRLSFRLGGGLISSALMVNKVRFCVTLWGSLDVPSSSYSREASQSPLSVWI